MKKIIATALLASLLLTSCNQSPSDSNSTTSSASSASEATVTEIPTATTSPSPTDTPTPEPEAIKEQAHDFDINDCNVIHVRGLDIPIPSSWEAINDDEYKIPDEGNAELMIQYGSSGEWSTMEALEEGVDDLCAVLFEGWEDFEILNTEHVKMCDDSLAVDYNSNLAGTPTSGRIVFNVDHGGSGSIVSLMLVQTADCKYDHTDDFNSLVASVADYMELTPEEKAAAEEELRQKEEHPEEYGIHGGQHLVGEDIPAGEYMIIAESGNAGYYCLSSDANGENIISNDNFSQNQIVTVSDGEYLQLNRCTAYGFDFWCSDNELDLTSYQCMLKVGVNIPAGEYQLEVKEDEDMGYYGVYSDNHVDNIVANDNFEGSAYVTVDDGQYLYLNRCRIVQE